ncbi:zinc ABC transporter permease subunit ZnuB [Telmatospirillum sp. J64-1]|uniref:zinc ABC transporter permease subunit ZnuB n=1 Tax=Telmatospirillum sp. J64-1 TaxID=2502183 RepID=UPI00115F5AC4|nr:zinc ABC transporter permease subunit ZnuB [Telmatospirillum sp. J64-1]
MDDFFLRALVGGVALALVAGPLGAFVVWRRMAYFGDTLAHAALMGVALGLLLEIHLTLAIIAVSGLLAVVLALMTRQRRLAVDTLLGILSHGTLSIGLVALAFMDWVRVDLMAYLFGDILAISNADLLLIFGGGFLVLGVLAVLWRPLLAMTVNEELAQVEGVPVAAGRLALMLLMAVVVAVALKIVGILLITSLLIIPAAAARRFAVTPEAMAILASLAGAAAVTGGLHASLAWDTPSGPSIVVVALLLFLLAEVAGAALRRR